MALFLELLLYAMKNMNQADLSKLDPEDLELFKKEMAGVSPLRSYPAPPSSVQKPRPQPHPRSPSREQATTFSTLLDQTMVPHLYADDEMHYLSPSYSKRILYDLGKGRYTIDKEIDLHGKRVPELERFITTQIKNARLHSQQVLLIIHGKGKNSEQNEPVIKSWLDTYLRRRKEVIAFCSARPCDGGTGAIYLLLKKLR